MKRILKYYKIVIPSILIGLLIGWILFSKVQSNTGNSSAETNQNIAEATMWTCSMHPQIKQEKPGLCPICAMDLIPLESSGSEAEGIDPNEVSMTESALELANIQTYTINSGKAVKEIMLQGKIVEDERNISEITARFGGRIEDLFINFTGQVVSKGQKLASIYSPELINAQTELFESIKMKESHPDLYESAKMKLQFWDLTEEQINEIEKLGKPLKYVDIISPMSGTVTMRHIAYGDYVKEGDKLFQVVDFSRLWIQLEAYESDLSWINLNDKVKFEINALPGKTYESRIDFIDPVIDPKTRVAKLRTSIDNKKGDLKPEMFVSAKVESNLSGGNDKILIPKTAVLWTGKRSLVYVAVHDREAPSFLMREVTLGADAGDMYVIEDGLKEGEEIVMNGVFKIDAAAHLRGLVSMMNPSGGMPGSTHLHEHEMSDSESMPTGESNESGMEDKTEHMADTEGYTVDPLFQLQLTDLFNSYIIMKDAFVLTKHKKVKKAAKKLLPVLEAVDTQFLEGDALEAWVEQYNMMKSAYDKIISTKDIEMQRLAFSDFNAGLYQAIKTFGIQADEIYYQYCPMAFNDQGAYWLSKEEQISNPYFGDVMLRCGEVKEVIK